MNQPCVTNRNRKLLFCFSKLVEMIEINDKPIKHVLDICEVQRLESWPREQRNRSLELNCGNQLWFMIEFDIEIENKKIKKCIQFRLKTVREMFANSTDRTTKTRTWLAKSSWRRHELTRRQFENWLLDSVKSRIVKRTLSMITTSKSRLKIRVERTTHATNTRIQIANNQLNKIRNERPK